jgi:hypothetical protein
MLPASQITGTNGRTMTNLEKKLSTQYWPNEGNILLFGGGGGLRNTSKKIVRAVTVAVEI